MTAIYISDDLICIVAVNLSGAPNEDIVQNHLNMALLNVF